MHISIINSQHYQSCCRNAIFKVLNKYKTWSQKFFTESYNHDTIVTILPATNGLKKIYLPRSWDLSLKSQRVCLFAFELIHYGFLFYLPSSFWIFIFFLSCFQGFLWHLEVKKLNLLKMNISWASEFDHISWELRKTLKIARLMVKL